MEPHPIDPVALVFGLLIGLGGLAIFADQQWDDVDVTAFAGAGVLVIALLLAGAVIVRQLGDRSGPASTSVIVAESDAGPARETDPVLGVDRSFEAGPGGDTFES